MNTSQIDIEAATTNPIEAFLSGVAEQSDTVRGSDVSAAKITWLWDQHIASGKFTLIDGAPGTGKSTMLMDLAARVTKGRVAPDGSGTKIAKGGVLILCSEDGADDTIVPRLAAAGADLSKVNVMLSVPDHKRGLGQQREIEIPRDIASIRYLIERDNVKLVIIDPLQSYLVKDQRNAAKAIARLAEETGAAILGVRHLTKSAKGPLAMQGLGGVGVVGTARMAFAIVKDPADPSVNLMVCSKSNIAERPQTLTYEMVSNEQYGVGQVEWTGLSDITEDDLINAGDIETQKATREASEFLEMILSEGPMATKVVEEIAKEKYCISKRALQRARRELGVLAYNAGDYWLIMLDPNRKEN